MKRKLLPLLIAAATAVAANSAFAAGPTVYGKVNVTMNQYELEKRGAAAELHSVVDEKDNWEFESNASRLGVKGDFDISTELKAIYKLEYEVYVDDGDDGSSNSSELNQRNIYGGLQGKFGTVIAGKNDTPLKLVQNTGKGSEIDRFNDLPLGDIKNIMVGENRESNIIMYSTPDFSGFGATLAIMPGEEDGTTDATDNNDGIADRASLALTYNAESFYVGIAADHNVQNTDIIRLAGEVTLGDVKLGALYQTAEVNDDEVPTPLTHTINSLPNGVKDFATFNEEQDAWIIGGEWTFLKDWALKAQYGMSESTPAQVSVATANLDDTELTMIALGVDFKLNKNSKVFAYYASIEGEGDSFYTNDSIEDKTFALGYELKF
jgi:predicted porin